MTDVLNSLVIRSWELNELVDEEEIEAVECDTISDERMYEGYTKRHIAVVVDGWHIRKNFVRQASKDVGQSLVDWLDSLSNWILTEFGGKDEVLTIDIVAWDAELRSDDEKKQNFKKLTDKQKNRYATNKSDRLGSLRSYHTDAVWKFCALQLREGGVLHQSGVDARIATDLFRAALDGANNIVLVSNDSDFVQAIELILDRFKPTQIDLLCYSSKPKAEFDGVVRKIWRGDFSAGSFSHVETTKTQGKP